MTSKLDRLITSKPKVTACVILILVVALAIVIAGFTLELSDSEPYPSDDLPMAIENGMVIYTENMSIGSQNSSDDNPWPYTGMKIILQVTDDNGFVKRPAIDFGNQSCLSTGVRASVHQELMNSSYVTVDINITDFTGNGAFGEGDTIAFDLDPTLKEGLVFTFGLLWVDGQGGGAAKEVSFAISDGQLYSWSSQTLGDWYWPYLLGEP